MLASLSKRLRFNTPNASILALPVVGKPGPAIGGSIPTFQNLRVLKGGGVQGKGVTGKP